MNYLKGRGGSSYISLGNCGVGYRFCGPADYQSKQLSKWIRNVTTIYKFQQVVMLNS
jgi:hypothetical protein